MLDKSRLGTRYTCYKCETKFYDLNRPAPICPECGADQSDAPVQDVKALLNKGGGKRRKVEPEEEPTPNLEEDAEDSDDSDDEELGLGLNDDDDDDLD